MKLGYNRFVTQLELSFLGPPLINLKGSSIETDRRKVIALLAYLAVNRKSHPREHLATLLWPDFERDSAYAYLRHSLWELNQILGKGWIEADRDSLALIQDEDVWLDTQTFLNRLSRYRQSSVRRSGDVNLLVEAIALYRDDFLAGFHLFDSAAFDDWQTQQAEAYRREFAGALENLVEGLGLQGKPEAAMPYARRWLELDPLDEAAHRSVMRLYAGMGDRASAVRQYQACVKFLKDELGVPPQPETNALYQQIVSGEFQVTHDPQASNTEARPEILQSRIAVADKSVNIAPVLRLPEPSTPFIGRRMEVEQIQTLLPSPDCRLLTLTGLGGTGKTRLAIQVAKEIAHEFSEGVFFIPLDVLNQGEIIVSSIAVGVGYNFYQGETPARQQLLDYLREKQILLVLDNFEHLIDQENIQLILDLLESAEGVKIIATTRTRLNVKGEQLFQVSGLEIPPSEIGAPGKDVESKARAYSALELFLECARRVDPNFQLKRENLEPVIRICQQVEGAPLGIELAAVWLEILSPDEIFAEITRSLDFLETHLKDIPERQRSLRAVYDSSWRLLDEEERQAFQKLTVFQGSFSREAAQQTSGASLRTLLGLSNKSWLQQSGDGRLRSHESLRQYANELLRSNTSAWLVARDAHCVFYSEFVETQGRALRGRGQILALEAIAEEFNSNIRTAFSWLIDRKRFGAITGQMLPGLFHFCLIRSLGPELIPLLKHTRQLLENESGRESQVWLAILMTAETFIEMRHEISADQPKERLAKIWALVKEQQLADDLGFWFVFLAREYAWEISFEEGGRQLIAVLPRIRNLVDAGLEDPWVLGCCLMFLGRLPLPGIADEDKVGFLNESLAIFQECGAIYEQALSLLSIGDATWRLRKSVVESTPHYHAARELFDKVGDQFGVATVWRILAEIHLLRGDFDQAFQAFREQGQVYERLGSRHPPTGSITFFGNRDFG